MSKVKILLLRRWYMVGGAALVLAAAIFWISSAQSTIGRMPVVAGAPMRRMPMGARFLRSTMALVHWVVPSIA